MSLPRISIIIPSYNQVNFIEQTIHSIVNQDYSNTEIIIIDGGSTDGTIEKIKQFEKDIDYWVSEKDQGQTNAINKGFRVATGDLVAWQNSDDYYLPGAFDKVTKAFMENEQDVYFGHKYNVDKNGIYIRPLCYVPYNLKANIYEGMVMASQATFWRRKLFHEVGYLDEHLNYAMDYDFFLRLGLMGCKFHLINNFFGCFRIHDDSKSNTVKHKWEAEIAYVDQKYNIKRPYKNFYIIYLRLIRSYFYLRQGQIKYIYDGVINRSKTSIAYLKM